MDPVVITSIACSWAVTIISVIGLFVVMFLSNR